MAILVGFILNILLSRIGLIEQKWKVFWVVLFSSILLTNTLFNKINRNGLTDMRAKEALQFLNLLNLV